MSLLPAPPCTAHTIRHARCPRYASGLRRRSRLRPTFTEGMTLGGNEHGRGTILLVDDDADIRRFVEMNLRLEGYRVLTAADGVMALAMVATEIPDLVLLDVMMPGLDGIEVTRRLRADSRTATTPI